MNEYTEADDPFLPSYEDGRTDFDGAPAEAADLPGYVDVEYRADEPVDDEHQNLGGGVWLAEDGRELAEANGEVELVSGTDRGVWEWAQPPEPGGGDRYLYPDDLAAENGLDGAADLARLNDARLASYIYESVREYGRDRFIAMPKGQVFWCDDGIWRGGSRAKNRLRKLAKDALAEHCSNNVISELEAEVNACDNIEEKYGMDRDDMGRPPWTVATPDGLLDLKTLETRPLRWHDWVMASLPTGYDPDAEYEGSLFQEFIEPSCPDSTERRLLKAYSGYALLPGQPYKRGAFLLGPTDSGKGTFLKILGGVLGEQNIAHQSIDRLMNTRWGADKIYGKMLNMDDEVAPRAVKRVERFKKLIGGEDVVTAEAKNQPTYEFRATQKFIFATNQFPSVPDADEAFFNRCLFVNFPNSVPPEEQVDRLHERIIEKEAEVVLKWAMGGLQWLKDRDGVFDGERSIEDKRSLTKSWGEPFEQFEYEILTITGDAGDCVHKAGLHDAFTRFCDFIEAEDIKSQGPFTSEMKKLAGVTEGQSRPVARQLEDAGENVDVFRGVRVDLQRLKEIQAPAPAYSTADGDEGAASQAQL